MSAQVRVAPGDLWRLVFEQWDAVVEPDLLERYRVDFGADPAAWLRPWSSLVGLILGLLDLPDSRLSIALRRLNEQRAPAAG